MPKGVEIVQKQHRGAHYHSHWSPKIFIRPKLYSFCMFKIFHLVRKGVWSRTARNMCTKFSWNCPTRLDLYVEFTHRTSNFIYKKAKLGYETETKIVYIIMKINWIVLPRLQLWCGSRSLTQCRLDAMNIWNPKLQFQIGILLPVEGIISRQNATVVTKRLHTSQSLTFADLSTFPSFWVIFSISWLIRSHKRYDVVSIVRRMAT